MEKDSLSGRSEVGGSLNCSRIRVLLADESGLFAKFRSEPDLLAHDKLRQGPSSFGLLWNLGKG